ncbi:von Willebrand factor type A domain-containing protein [Chaetomium sp. MPI-SDFR-AT-0129]|nr:von Willebrand factor type A domain-containing protein [Chaetomium sp. MPI-SDFR-AT-0129]
MPPWNSIYAAGIFWDPDEPLPAELQHELHQQESYGHDVHTHIALHTRIPGTSPGPYAQFDAGYGSAKPKTLVRHPPTPLPQFTVQEPGRNVLPPRTVTADVSIVQDTAKVAVTQLFWNDASAPIKEAAFTFPLPNGCTVTEFTCRIGNSKIIRGAVKPKDDARQAFRKHIRTHDTAAGLLEQATPEIFTTTLGNLPAQTKVQVQLTYITVLKHRFTPDDSQTTITTLTLPTSIAPRYGQTPKDVDIAAASTNVPEGLTLNVEIIEAGRITTVTSPSSHAITVTRQRGSQTAQSFADLAGQTVESKVETASVVLADGPVLLEKDFVLDIASSTGTSDDEDEAADSETQRPQAWLEHHPTLANHKTLMLTLPPKCLTTAPLPDPPTTTTPLNTHEILLLADRSGSMRRKIPALQSALHYFLKGIPLNRVFNIWCFGTSYSSWQPASVAYTQENLKNGLSWVQSPQFQANMGGTELFPALEAMLGPIMEEEEDSHHDDEGGSEKGKKGKKIVDVIILTDGQTWRLEQTIELVRKARDRSGGRVRVFALGIGNRVSHALVDGLAKAGGGYAEVVPEGIAAEGWEERVVGMTKAALVSRHLGPVRVVFGVREGDKIIHSTLVDAKRSPADVSALSPFDHNRIYFHLPPSSGSKTLESVHLELEADGQHTIFPIPVTVLPKPDTTLHKLAARAMLDDLERGTSSIHLGPHRPPPGSWDETRLVRREAEKIACKWSLVSKWTSFFLAEEPCPPPAVPFPMSEKDLLANGIIEVKPGPGEDLLQPRGPEVARQHVAALEPVELESVSGNYMLDRSRRRGQDVVDSLVARPNFSAETRRDLSGGLLGAAAPSPGAQIDATYVPHSRPSANFSAPPMLRNRASGPSRLSMNRESRPADEGWNATAGTPPSPSSPTPQSRDAEKLEAVYDHLENGSTAADGNFEWVKKRARRSDRLGERDRDGEPKQERERLRKRFDSADERGTARGGSAAQAMPDTGGYNFDFPTFTPGEWSDTIELTPTQLTELNGPPAETSYCGPGSAAPPIVPMGPDAFRQPSHSMPRKKKKPLSEAATKPAEQAEEATQTAQGGANPRFSSPVARDADCPPITGDSSTPALSPPSPNETFPYETLDFYADRSSLYHSRVVGPGPGPNDEGAGDPKYELDGVEIRRPASKSHHKASRRYSSYQIKSNGTVKSGNSHNDKDDEDRRALPPPPRPPRSPPAAISKSVSGDYAGKDAVQVAGGYAAVPILDRLRDRSIVPQPLRPKKQKPTEKSFVHALLRYQEFDGAIDFGSWEVAGEVLGGEVVKVLRAVLGKWTGGNEGGNEGGKETVDANPDLSTSTASTEAANPNPDTATSTTSTTATTSTTNPNPDDTSMSPLTKLLWTTATHLLLARDFRATKSLWDLIALKACAYCVNHRALILGIGGEKGVKAALVGVKTPVHMDAPVDVESQKEGEKGEDKKDEGKGEKGVVENEKGAVASVDTLGGEEGGNNGQEGDAEGKQREDEKQESKGQGVEGQEVGIQEGSGTQQSETVDVDTTAV